MIRRLSHALSTIHPRALTAGFVAAVFLAILQFEIAFGIGGWPFEIHEPEHLKWQDNRRSAGAALSINIAFAIAMTIGVTATFQRWVGGWAHRDRLSLGNLLDLTTLAATVALAQSSSPGVHQLLLRQVESSLHLQANSWPAYHYAYHLMPVVLAAIVGLALASGILLMLVTTRVVASHLMAMLPTPRREAVVSYHVVAR